MFMHEREKSASGSTGIKETTSAKIVIVIANY